jgi:hypothetical protein
MPELKDLSKEELIEKVTSLEARLSQTKEAFTASALKRFARSTADLCLDIEVFSRKLIDSLQEICAECPHKREFPCSSCALIADIQIQMSAEEREAQRRSFAFGNAAMHNQSVTRDLIDREAEKLGSEKPETP